MYANILKSQATRRSDGDEMNLHVMKGHMTDYNIRSHRKQSRQYGHTASSMSAGCGRMGPPSSVPPHSHTAVIAEYDMMPLVIHQSMPPGYSTTPHTAVSALALTTAYLWDSEPVDRLMPVVETQYVKIQDVVVSNVCVRMAGADVTSAQYNGPRCDLGQSEPS